MFYRFAEQNIALRVLDPERIAKGSTAHVLLLDPIQIDSIGLSSDGN